MLGLLSRDRQSDMLRCVELCWSRDRQSGVGLCGCSSMSDMLGFVVVRPSVSYVGLCDCSAVSLTCWALWLYGRQSDMLGFVAVLPSV